MLVVCVILLLLSVRKSYMFYHCYIHVCYTCLTVSVPPDSASVQLRVLLSLVLYIFVISQSYYFLSYVL